MGQPQHIVVWDLAISAFELAQCLLICAAGARLCLVASGAGVSGHPDAGGLGTLGGTRSAYAASLPAYIKISGYGCAGMHISVLVLSLASEILLSCLSGESKIAGVLRLRAG